MVRTDMETTEPKSKSQMKREQTALQALGEQLVELAPDQIQKIDMPQDLREAILFARKMKRGEARRRQLQYVGVLMREADPEPIEKALEVIGSGRRQDAAQFHELEQWRDELVKGNEALLEEIVGRFPDADRQRLRQLASNARKEAEGEKPPKSSRALFRLLQSLVNG
ncbi:MAG: ribosome biogenesis factor YjgA [Syntrophobacteraceae bacterium]